MGPAAPYAVIGPRRQVHVVNSAGKRITCSLPDDLMWGSWRVTQAATASYSWPTWSPDGDRIACFRVGQGEEGTAKVFLLDVRGVATTELADLDGRLPIYLYWAPDASKVAVLSQREADLVLSSFDTHRIRPERRLAQGSPLFFTWAGSDRVAAYVGTDRSHQGQMILIDARGTHERILLPGDPTNFCAPVWVDGEVVYVTRRRDHAVLVAGRADDPEPRELETVNGLVALVPSADGKSIARAVAPDGDGTPYQELAVLDVSSGEIRQVSDSPCLAFLWSPLGDALVVARVDTERNLLVWERIDLDGTKEHLVDMHPTRDLGFYLRFFEQYSQSHPLIDPTGTSLLVAGGLADSNDGTARIWRVPLAGGPPTDMGEGLFAVYGPLCTATS